MLRHPNPLYPSRQVRRSRSACQDAYGTRFPWRV